MPDYICTVELKFAVDPTSRADMFELLSTALAGRHRSFEPGSANGEQGVFELQFDVQADSLARADQAAAVDVNRVIAQLGRYAPQIASPPSCVKRAPRPVAPPASS